MARALIVSLILSLCSVAVSGAFVVPRSVSVAVPTASFFEVRATSDDNDTPSSLPPVPSTFGSRGVSIDQDGQSNVWAIEPKMEVDAKSKEEKTQSTLFAVGGFAAFGVMATVVLTNLPDPNQF